MPVLRWFPPREPRRRHVRGHQDVFCPLDSHLPSCFFETPTYRRSQSFEYVLLLHPHRIVVRCACPALFGHTCRPHSCRSYQVGFRRTDGLAASARESPQAFPIPAACPGRLAAETASTVISTLLAGREPRIPDFVRCMKVGEYNGHTLDNHHEVLWLGSSQTLHPGPNEPSGFRFDDPAQKSPEPSSHFPGTGDRAITLVRAPD